MDILFRTAQLQRLCSTMAALTSWAGGGPAQRLALRLQQLAAVACLDDLQYLPAACRKLSGDHRGQFSLDVCHPYRLVFEPTDPPRSAQANGEIDWKAVDSITVIAIVDVTKTDTEGER